MTTNITAIVCSTPSTYSKVPPIMVEKDKFCEECNSVHDFEKCPLCGSWIGFNYGMGNYAFCENVECDWRYETGCGGNFIEEYFISAQQYLDSDRYPIHCNPHDRDAWECFDDEVSLEETIKREAAK